jgi:hypothetical protein
MHRSDSCLPSGRIEMWKLVPILFISPILTTFVPHWDLPIYLLVIYAFTFAILSAFRRLCHEWTDWHLKLPVLTETKMVQWFQKRFPDQREKDDATIVTAARVALAAEVCKIEDQKRWWTRKTHIDEFAGPIAHNLPLMNFLLSAHSGGSGTPPELFSSTWFVQYELALNNNRQLMRGLKEHSAFIHYRYSRYDVSGPMISEQY